VAPKDAASGRVACLVCHREQDDLLHKDPKAADTEIHW
jgi:hypothetical protein